MTRNISLLKFVVFINLLIFSSHISKAQYYKPNETAAANKTALMKFLREVYGKKIISGQMDDKYLSYIVETTGGKSPAMMGYDFNGICPSQSGNNDAAKAINWVKNKGGIAQFQWHWISPNADGDFYSHAFNLGNALKDTNSTSYKNMIRDIDLVAGAMKKMKDAGVPILWRPLHEAEGQWFWWGFSGGDACKKLYRLMYDRFVNRHKLDNLIWVWNSYGKTKENWYPGDDVVDIIAWDYPDYSQNSGSWSQYQQMFGSKGKMFGVGEDGKLTDPKILSTQGWLYFLTWAYMVQEPSQKDGKNTKDWLKQVYNDPRVITLEDLIPGPKASAGTAQLVFDTDGNGFENVVLDGSASKTDEGTISAYEWTENGSTIATGVKPEIQLALGIHTIQLKITTSVNATKTAQVIVTVKTPTISLNKPVTVSSTEANLGNVAANANDGNAATRWSSAYSDPQWYQVDLGKKYDISKVVILWEAASAKSYSIDVSDDGSNWSTLVSKSNMPSGARTDELKIQSGSGRFVRMNGIERNTNYGYSFFEFEVYGAALGETGFLNRTIQDLKIYPTSVKMSQYLTFQIPSSSANASLSIYANNGRLIKQFSPVVRDVQLCIDSSFPKGIYMVRFVNAEMISGGKFIIA